MKVAKENSHTGIKKNNFMINTVTTNVMTTTTITSTTTTTIKTTTTTVKAP